MLKCYYCGSECDILYSFGIGLHNFCTDTCRLEYSGAGKDYDSYPPVEDQGGH